MSDFERDYAQELSFLRTQGRAFAAEHPHNASHLDLRAEDPDIERLLEGFAFMSAGIRAHIDDATGLFARRLLASLGPHWIRPMPPATVVEFRPDLRAIRSVQRLARGKEVLAAPLDGVCARFTTAADVDLAPIELLKLEVLRPRPGHAAIQLRFRASDAGTAVVPTLDHLRLFVHHRDPTVTATLRMWLTRYCTRISGEGGASESMSGPRPSLTVPFADLRARLLPWPEATPPAIQALVEGLAYPDLLGFVDLRGLRSLGFLGPEFSVLLEFQGREGQPPPPQLPPRLPESSLRLHCAPALNLFEATGEPFEHRPGARPHLLRADGTHPGYMEVFSVKEVSVGGVAAQRRLCGVLPADTDAPTFEVDRSPGPRGVNECRLALETPLPDEEPVALVSTRLLCTHGELAHDLGIGSLGYGPRHLLLASATNVTPVSPPRRPSLAADRCWRLLDHLGLRARPLRSAAALRDLLSLHAPPGGSEEHGPLRPRSLAAIRDLRRRRSYQLVDGIATPVLETTVEVDVRELSCIAEAELLGELLDPLLADFAGFDAASVLTLHLFPAGDRLDWPLRTPCTADEP